MGNKELPKLHWGIYLLGQGWPRSGGLEWQQFFQPWRHSRTPEDKRAHVAGYVSLQEAIPACPFLGLSLALETSSQDRKRERKEWPCPLKLPRWGDSFIGVRR